ncbi:MAG TPA: two-component regulator propeller domain-containing protein, partial [Bacteroidales bacterium]|nr:two-component regulator propeller domain-containing protein [Bacteroidales bacterium]
MRIATLTIFLFLFANSLTAQQNSFRFTRYNVDDGLSQNWVRAIGQDSSGVVWFGTKDGLDRFFGYNIYSFNYIPFSSGGLNHPTINSITTIGDKLWIGTQNGINIFDLSGKKLTSFPFLRDMSVTSVKQDQGGNMWLGTDRGLYRLSPDRRMLTHMNEDVLPEGLLGDTTQCLLVDSQKTLWVGTNNGLNRIFTDEKGN